MPTVKRLPRKRMLKNKLTYRGQPLTQETQAQLNTASAMTPERIQRVRALLIPELRELLDAKVVK